MGVAYFYVLKEAYFYENVFRYLNVTVFRVWMVSSIHAGTRQGCTLAWHGTRMTVGKG